MPTNDLGWHSDLFTNYNYSGHVHWTDLHRPRMLSEGYNDIQAGDVLECYKTQEVKRTL